MKNRGFTIIELLIVLAIVGIFAMIAAPNFMTMIQDNRLTAQTNNLLGTLYYARSEAVKLHADVTVCKSSNGTSCISNTDASGWELGWLVWQDADGSLTVDVGETILRVGPASEGGNIIWVSAAIRNVPANNTLTFSSRGLASASGIWQICDTRGISEAKAIVINTSGRARISETLDTGGALTCS